MTTEEMAQIISVEVFDAVFKKSESPMAVGIDLCRNAAAAIQAKLAEERQWHPIETAPKDGTLLLLVVEGEFECGSWNQQLKYWVGLGNGYYDGCARELTPPTAWMPRPALQEEAKP